MDMENISAKQILIKYINESLWQKILRINIINIVQILWNWKKMIWYQVKNNQLKKWDTIIFQDYEENQRKHIFLTEALLNLNIFTEVSSVLILYLL